MERAREDSALKGAWAAARGALGSGSRRAWTTARVCLTASGRTVTQPRMRAAIAIGVFVVIAALELVFGVLVYCNSWRVDVALGLACGGVVVLAILDAWIRPRRVELGARYLRRWLPLWVLVPFVCALASSAWIHYVQWRGALRDVHEIARELTDQRPATAIQSLDARVIALTCDRFADDLAGAGPLPHPEEGAPAPGGDGAKPARSPEPRGVELACRRFADRLTSSEELRHFHELARVVAHDVKIIESHPPKDDWIKPCKTGDSPCIVRKQAQRDTILDFLLTLGAQAVFVMWIPVLLAISMARAIKKLDERKTGPEMCAPPPGREARSLQDSLEQRDSRILAEDRMYFVPRLCFGTLLVLGTTYVFAPFGLRASYLLSLVEDHALPGHTTFALWSNNFASAPVIVVGFVGFLIYALITATRRFAQDDLDDQALFSLLVRGLVVILLSFALSTSPINDEAARLFVFIAGVFPLRALEAIAKRANVSIDPDFSTEGPGSFEAIPCLDPAKVFALRAAGIESAYDLAAIPIKEIAGRVRIDPHLLGRAVDRAILIDAVGPKLTGALEPFAITSATELVDALPVPTSVSGSLGDAPQRAAERLASDERVKTVRRWLTCSPQ